MKRFVLLCFCISFFAAVFYGERLLHRDVSSSIKNGEILDSARIASICSAVSNESGYDFSSTKMLLFLNPRCASCKNLIQCYGALLKDPSVVVVTEKIHLSELKAMLGQVNIYPLSENSNAKVTGYPYLIFLDNSKKVVHQRGGNRTCETELWMYKKYAVNGGH